MGKEAWAMLVAILGTTISPYLFFWQASQEVEEEKAMGRRMLVSRQGATSREIADRKLDVGFGTFASNLVMFFVILTTALTLHAHGATKIENTRQVAEALRPLAGSTAALLFTVGILGVGFLAIPTLSGSAEYAFAETFHWRQGLDQKLARARGRRPDSASDGRRRGRDVSFLSGFPVTFSPTTRGGKNEIPDGRPSDRRGMPRGRGCAHSGRQLQPLAFDSLRGDRQLPEPRRAIARPGGSLHRAGR